MWKKLLVVWGCFLGFCFPRIFGWMWQSTHISKLASLSLDGNHLGICKVKTSALKVRWGENFPSIPSGLIQTCGSWDSNKLKGSYLTKTSQGLPWWLKGQESVCQHRRHGFYPRSRKIPHVSEQLSLSTTNWLKPTCLWSSCSAAINAPAVRSSHTERRVAPAHQN